VDETNSTGFVLLITINADIQNIIFAHGLLERIRTVVTRVTMSARPPRYFEGSAIDDVRDTSVWCFDSVTFASGVTSALASAAHVHTDIDHRTSTPLVYSDQKHALEYDIV
jgi:hypothetical protein